MKHTYFKGFFKKLGIKNTIGLIVSALFVTIGAIAVINNFGKELLIETAALNIFFKYIDKVIDAIKKVKDEYTIETKK